MKYLAILAAQFSQYYLLKVWHVQQANPSERAQTAQEGAKSPKRVTFPIIARSRGHYTYKFDFSIGY
jgi:hypothetical protein